jgi:alpha-1,3-rhamnosyl/mannosyltransferase
VPVSGVARYCLSLANALVRLRNAGELGDLPAVDVLVQTARGGNRTLNALDPQLRAVELTMFGRSRKTQNLVAEFVPALAAATALRRYPLVHETYFANLAATPRQHKVATIHDVIPLDQPAFFNRNNRLLTRRNLHRQARLSDAIIAVSAYTKQRVVELTGCDPARVRVIGNGVDAADAAKGRDAVWPIAGKLPAGENYGLYVGNLEPRKNVDALIKAWAMLPPRHRDVKLVVAGKLNYQAEATIAHGQERLGNRFSYLGPVSEADKWGAIAAARALVLPSLFEGYGVPIIEAYLAGTPALFSNTTSMTELATDPRQMFDPHDPAAMAEVIAHTLDDPAWLAEAGDRAGAWAAGQSWDRVARDVAQVYREVLAR